MKDFKITLAEGRKLSLFYRKFKNLKIIFEKNLKRVNFRLKVETLAG
jgi:hypothetical protein